MRNGNGHPPVNAEIQEYFISPSKGNRKFDEVVADVIEFITADATATYTVGVGTDSEQESGSGKAGAKTAEFVSVVVVHRVGKHGRYFWKRTRGYKAFDRHDRILKEAFFSLNLAQRLVGELRDKLDERLYKFEIHLDVGHNGPTKSMIQEVVGLVTGNGFTARIKPDSYAANKVADRHVDPARSREGSQRDPTSYGVDSFGRSLALETA